MAGLRTLVSLVVFAGILSGFPEPATASETRVFTYDARGRLVSVVSSGTVNNGRATTYCHDGADNRTQVISNDSGAQASCSPSVSCALRTVDKEGDDENWIYVGVVEVGACPIDVPLSYSIQYVSGTGSYVDRGWYYGDGVISASETYENLVIDPDFHSVPAGQELVLQVTFSTSASGVTISPNVSTVTIYSSW